MDHNIAWHGLCSMCSERRKDSKSFLATSLFTIPNTYTKIFLYINLDPGQDIIYDIYEYI